MSFFTDNVLPIFLHTLKESVSVTALVLLVMSVVELINASSVNKLFYRLKGKTFIEILCASALGSIPGCTGGFIVVALFSQNIISFAALCAGLIATFGDEAIYLYTQSPKNALLVTLGLFIIALCTGLIINILFKNKFNSDKQNIVKDDCSHLFEIGNTDIKSRISYFFKDHIWNHIIKKHALTVFLSIFITLFAIKFAELFVDIGAILTNNVWATWLMLIIAVLIGLLPVSGPHLIFVILFLQGIIPFGILMANSISQNGHAGIALLSNSRRIFLLVKLITLILGLIVGALLLI